MERLARDEPLLPFILPPGGGTAETTAPAEEGAVLRPASDERAVRAAFSVAFGLACYVEASDCGVAGLRAWVDELSSPAGPALGSLAESLRPWVALVKE